MNRYFHISNGESGNSIGVILVDKDEPNVGKARSRIVEACECHFEAVCTIVFPDDFLPDVGWVTLLVQCLCDGENREQEIIVEQTYVYL